MKPWNSWFCTQCEEIFQDTTRLTRCPSCTSSAIQPMSLYIKPMTGRKEQNEMYFNPNPINVPDNGICRRAFKKAYKILRGENLWKESEADQLGYRKRVQF